MTNSHGRVAVVYDCFYPSTIGGEEFFLRHVVDAFVARGCEVEYLTRRQWDDVAPAVAGATVIDIAPRAELYRSDGSRRLGPSLGFGWAVFRALLARRRRYDHVVVASFPFFSVIGARAALVHDAETVVQWVELWRYASWREYAGRVVGSVGYGVQRLCVALTKRAISISPLVTNRLFGRRRQRDVLTVNGLVPPHPGGAVVAGPEPYVLVAGRHVRDKGIDLVPAIAREVIAQRPDMGFVVAGDGPMTPWVRAELAAAGLSPRVTMIGFVSEERLNELVARATCVLAPSRREGYGVLVAQSTTLGTPVVVAPFSENASVDLVVDGVNGFVASDTTPYSIAKAVLRVIDAGTSLRASAREYATASGVDVSVERAAHDVAHFVLSGGDT